MRTTMHPTTDTHASKHDFFSHCTPYIQSSWKRCQQKHKISPQRSIKLSTLTESEIREKRGPLEHLLADAAPIIDRLRWIANQSGYSVLISDAEGVTVNAFTDSDHALALQSKGIRLGTLWHEAVVGTNGLGTCLEEKRPIIVDAREHYGTNLHCFSCVAAPLIQADGSILGALDMSTFAQGNRTKQSFALNFVTKTADEIEAHIFRKAYLQQHIISLNFSFNSNTALIAFNDSGTIIAATTQALQHLNCRQRYDLVGKNVQQALQLNLNLLINSRSLQHPFQFNGQSLYTQLSLHSKTLHSKALHSSQPHSASLPHHLHTSRQHPPKTPSSTLLQPLLDAAGEDPQLLQQTQRCLRVVDRGLSVLLQGETGTGKEVWARALHAVSARKDKPFVALNCAAIPEALIESELFGYGAGTFTGGLKSGKMGKIQASHGGTLFLDEMGDMPAELQARLLRVLAEREIVPLGELEPIAVDITLICASHRHLEQEVSLGKFREDLYYRLSAFKITLPPLRERQDKRHLINTLLVKCQQECQPTSAYENSQPLCLSTQAENALLHFAWPGNIRQLKNVLNYAVCMCDDTVIQLQDLPPELQWPHTLALTTHQTAHASTSPTLLAKSDPLHDTQLEVDAHNMSEKQHLLNILQQNRWIVTRAAKALGVSRSTLHRKIKRHELHMHLTEV